jgi:N-formylglutamate amidohydrolase
MNTAQTPDQLASMLIEHERRIAHYDIDPPTLETGIVHVPGTVPLIISAPHSARHQRAGIWKQEEEYTAAFGFALHQQVGASLVYASYQIAPDPHDDGDHNPYKQLLAQMIETTRPKLLIDLHGARGDRDFAYALGTIDGQTFSRYQSALLECFRAEGFTDDAPCSLDRVALNLPRYTGGARLPTITRYVWERHGIPAVQIELNAWVRVVQRFENATNAKNGTSPHFCGDRLRLWRGFRALCRFLESI